MAGQDLASGFVKVMTAQSNMVQYQAVVAGSAEDTCTGASAANDPAFVGFLLNAVTSGSTVAVHVGGGYALGIAGADVSAGSYGKIEGTDGRLANISISNTNQYVVCKFLRNGADGDVVPVKLVEFIANLP